MDQCSCKFLFDFFNSNLYMTLLSYLGPLTPLWCPSHTKLLYLHRLSAFHVTCACYFCVIWIIGRSLVQFYLQLYANVAAGWSVSWRNIANVRYFPGDLRNFGSPRLFNLCKSFVPLLITQLLWRWAAQRMKVAFSEGKGLETSEIAVSVCDHYYHSRLLQYFIINQIVATLYLGGLPVATEYLVVQFTLQIRWRK